MIEIAQWFAALILLLALWLVMVGLTVVPYVLGLAWMLGWLA